MPRVSVETVIEDISGKKTPAINIIGGGSKETLLCKYTADACGVPVTAGPSEATAIGNLASQAIACGELKDLSEARQMIRESFDVESYEPDPATKAIWDEGYEKYKKLIK